MVHKSSLVPGFSKFIDENVLANYPATSFKRICLAGAVSLYLKKGERIVDTLASNPLFTGLGVVSENGMIDIDPVRESLKREISKAGFMRVSIPLVGDIDFTTDDVDSLHRFIVEVNTQMTTTQQPIMNQTCTNNGGIY